MSVQEVLAGGVLGLAGPSLRLLPRTAMRPPADEPGKLTASGQDERETVCGEKKRNLAVMLVILDPWETVH